METNTRSKPTFKEKSNSFINNRVSVWGAKIAAQRHVASLRDAFIAYMPFLIVGAFFMIISNFPITAWTNFIASKPWLDGLIIFPKRITFDMMSFWICALMAMNLSKHYKMNVIFPMIISVGLFLMLTPLGAPGEGGAADWWVGSYIPFGGYTGTNGILLAVVVAIFVPEIFNFCKNKNIKVPLPSAVPPAVQASFSALIPIFLVIIVGMILRPLFGLTTYGYLPTILEQWLAAPISESFIGKFGGVTLVSLLHGIGWTVGINAAAINGVIRAFWTPLLQDNQDAWQHYINTGEYVWNNFNIGVEDFYVFVDIGGGGATMGIVFFMAIFARSEKVKVLAKISLIPAIFNINEPFLFGMPVVLNPMMWLPLILAPVACAMVTYWFMSMQWVWMPMGAVNAWTLPIGLLGYFANLHWSGAAMQIFAAVIATVIWYPFVKYDDMMSYRAENNIQEGGVLSTFKVAKNQGILLPLFGKQRRNDKWYSTKISEAPYKQGYYDMLQEYDLKYWSMYGESVQSVQELLKNEEFNYLERNISKEEKSDKFKKFKKQVKNNQIKLKNDQSDLLNEYKPILNSATEAAKNSKSDWKSEIRKNKLQMKSNIKQFNAESKQRVIDFKESKKPGIVEAKEYYDLPTLDMLRMEIKMFTKEEQNKIIDFKLISQNELVGKKTKKGELVSKYYKNEYSIVK